MKHLIILMACLSLGTIEANTSGTFRYRTLQNNAFGFGEELNFRVHYGFINAANVKIKVGTQPVTINDRPTYHITAFGKTLPSFDWAYRVRDHFESYVDMESIAPLKYFKYVQEDDYKDVDLVYYDHADRSLRGKKQDMDNLPEYVQDIVSSIYYARNIDFRNAKPGQSWPINVYLDQKVYQLDFKFMGEDVVKSDVGKIRCYKIKPRLVVDRVFKDEDDMTVWVSADQNKLPVRIETGLFVGSIRCDLTSYKNLKNPLSSLVKK